YLRALRELGERAGNVVFEHTVSESALADRYAAASAFLCLSEHEGFCVPLLEAFAAEVPVIARPSGGVPETAGDAALLVDHRGPDRRDDVVGLARDRHVRVARVQQRMLGAERVRMQHERDPVLLGWDDVDPDRAVGGQPRVDVAQLQRRAWELVERRADLAA